MAAILGIGIATIDIIHTVDAYPQENAEIRALQRERVRGGNVTNTLTVLAQLGHRCEWGGVLLADSDGDFVRHSLLAAGVGLEHCRTLTTGSMPTSYILRNRGNGSRTIVHYRDLPEFSAEDFQAIPCARYDWVHFEGRNVAATRQMLQRLRAAGFGGRISLEIEKERPEIDLLFPLADVLIFSRVFAHGRGYTDAADFLASVRHRYRPPADLICAWGESGAFALDRMDQPCHSPAFPPPQVVDTLGAGDVFNAALIHGCLAQQTLPAALENACRLAGRKCGQLGLTALLTEQDAGL